MRTKIYNRVILHDGKRVMSREIRIFFQNEHVYNNNTTINEKLNIDVGLLKKINK